MNLNDKNETKKQNIKLQVQNRKPLMPSYDIPSPYKISAEEKKLKVCPICKTKFKPKKPGQKTCSNELCILINKYDNFIQKYVNLRTNELLEEYN